MRLLPIVLASLGLLGGTASVSETLLPGVLTLSAVPLTYRRIAYKHRLDPRALYQVALQTSGRAGAYNPNPLPWPWTLTICAGATCQILYLPDRATLYEVAQAALAQDLTLHLGPVGYTYRQDDVLPLWTATDPKVSLNAWAQAAATAQRAPVSAARDRLTSPGSRHAARSALSPTSAASPAPLRGHARAKRYTPLINRISREEGVNPALIHAVVTVESNYHPGALSHAGAEGLMQLMPATAERFGLAATERTDPAKNLRAGIRYLKFLHRYFQGDIALMLAGYNAGEGAVEKYNRTVPPYPETQAYVKKVQGLLARYSIPGASS